MLLDWIFQSSGKRILKKISPIVDKINSLEGPFSQLTKEDMLQKMHQFKINVQTGVTTLDEILPEVFAMVREVSKRTIKKRHFDVQLLGGYIIHKGMIAEMKTGEGKTLVATLPAVLNSLTGKTVFVVTVNDYLAQRDCELLLPIYEYLGISADYVVPSCNQELKHKKYAADIVYITNNEICFDYLRDNMVKNMEEKLQKNHYFAIVDEIDNILIDESRTPLIISGPDNEATELYQVINPVIYQLEPHDYEIEPKSKNVTLKNTGFDKVESFLNAKGLIKNDLFSENVGVYHIVSNLLKAHKGMVRDKDYVVYKDEVIIVDEFTGRLAFGRKFSNGLHQGLEAKEEVTVRKNSKTNAFISYTNFFRLFNKIGGMTGTASSEADELDEIYNLNVVQVPTNKPMIRKDDNLIRLYHKKEDMYVEALKIIKEKHSKNQPMLLCTPSVFDSESLSQKLEEANLPHYVLNAKNHEQEASIVAQAGKSGFITIATNMAGRGTDIMLGGSLEAAIKEFKKNNPDLDVDKFETELAPEFAKDKKIVESAGGLCVILLGALESEKARLQFIGRAGRQGDPGESFTMVSLEDDLLLQLFKDALNRMFISLFFPDRCNTNARAQALVKDIQDMYQTHYFDIRKNMLKYDDVINLQRKAVYGFRDYIMSTSFPQEFLEQIVRLSIRDLCDPLIKNKTSIEKAKKEVQRYFDEEFSSFPELESKIMKNLSIKIKDKATEDLRSAILNTFDEKWYEQINELENLKRTIFLVSFAQRDPVFEFRRAAFDLFMDMIREFRLSVLEEFMNDFASSDDFMNYNSVFSDFQSTECFCGSGQSFQNCHGKNMFENFNLDKMQNAMQSIFGEMSNELEENMDNNIMKDNESCNTCDRDTSTNQIPAQQISQNPEEVKKNRRFKKPTIIIKAKDVRIVRDPVRDPKRRSSSQPVSPTQGHNSVRRSSSQPVSPAQGHKAPETVKKPNEVQKERNEAVPIKKNNFVIKGKLIKSQDLNTDPNSKGPKRTGLPRRFPFNNKNRNLPKS